MNMMILEKSVKLPIRIQGDTWNMNIRPVFLEHMEILKK